MKTHLLGKLDFKAIESKHARRWEKLKLYEFYERDAKKTVYSIDSPPPFTSGGLHMGHMLSYSYFDFAARYKRMQGFNVFYPQGWDCQGFPTEIQVEKKFGKHLPRKEFLEKAREFTRANIEAMKTQMKQMGFSPDWRFEYRTMDADYHRRVQHSLLKMFEKALVYRGKHPVLFCTNCQSAIAKAETDEIDRENTLSFISFKAADGKGEMVVATTRPELLHACAAVFIHQTDERYAEWVGRRVVVPLFGKQVDVKNDADVDKLFGTGAVMVCSYGDKADVQWIYRHKLPVVEAMTEDGRLQNASPSYDGLAAGAARERIIEDLRGQGLLVKQEKLKQVVKVHDRCGKPVEYLGSSQWFIKIREAKEKIVAAGREMRWIPEFSIQYLIDWAEFVDYDWVISRQRVYGTPLPFWYCEKCGEVYAPDYKKLPVDPGTQEFGEAACKCGGKIVGEASTCDCWVDSSITPLVIAGWPDDGKKFEKLYPATLRPQGLEIIRTWAFYTIARCLALTGKPPFKQVLINGSVLGTDGRKMSKSLGNYEDPDVLLKKYSADALRQWAALSGAFARDRPFSYKDVEYSQAFLNKLWNASKLAEKALEGYSHAKEKVELRATDKWLLSKLNKLVKHCTQAMNNYDYYACITAVQQFVWHEFCDYYLEEIKYRIYGDNAESKRAAQYCLYETLNASLKLLAPFACFVADEVYCELFASREGKQSVHECAWPAAEEEYINAAAENIVEVLHSLLSEVRRFKASKSLALNEGLSFAELVLLDTLLKDFSLVEEELRQVGKIESVSAVAGDSVKMTLKV